MAELPTNWGDSRRIPEVWPLSTGIAQVRDRYGSLIKSPGLVSQALNGVIRAAETLGADHLWFEWEYIDADWRDEFAHFYSTIYRSVPDRCERVHFVRDEPFEYLGFVSMRPLLGAPIGRTILAPPPAIADAVAAKAPVRAHPWGRTDTVVGFPYISQDRQLGRCAHANVWMVALYYHHRLRTRRVYLSEIAEAADGAPFTGRSVPSSGLTVPQMSAALRKAGLAPVHYLLDQLPADEDLLGVVCRYLNSGFPVLLVTQLQGAASVHVTVLVGYGRNDDGSYFFIRHDDERGPYQRVQPVKVAGPDGARWADPDTGRWTQILAPLPGKIYMRGEEAERLIRRIVLPQIIEDYPELKYLADGLQGEPRLLRLRTYATESWRYKSRAGLRGLGIERREALVLRGMPRFVWVTEIQRIMHPTTSRDCVIAEFVVDATAHPQTAGVLYATLPGLQAELSSLGQQINYDVLPNDSIEYFAADTRVHW